MRRVVKIVALIVLACLAAFLWILYSVKPFLTSLPEEETETSQQNKEVEIEVEYGNTLMLFRSGDCDDDISDDGDFCQEIQSRDDCRVAPFSTCAYCIGPEGVEVNDGVDNDCDGLTDEVLVDTDGDSVGDVYNHCPLETIDPRCEEADEDCLTVSAGWTQFRDEERSPEGVYRLSLFAECDCGERWEVESIETGPASGHILSGTVVRLAEGEMGCQIGVAYLNAPNPSVWWGASIRDNEQDDLNCEERLPCEFRGCDPCVHW